MNANTYYAKNAELHGQEAACSSVIMTNVLPPKPSEVDWAIFWLMRTKSRGTCLDVGCGQLTLLRSVEPLFQQRYGADIAAHNNWSKYPKIGTQVCNLDEGLLPFADQTCDAVVMLMVLEHLFNPFHAVREIRRVCKPDGHIIIAVPNIAGIRQRFALLQGRLPITSARFTFQEEAWDGYHLHNFTQASLCWLLRRAGLEPIDWASAGNFRYLKKARPSLFGGDLITLCRVTNPISNLDLSF